MIPRLLVTIGIVFYAVVVPIFEINASHVFNPGWEGHARLHESGSSPPTARSAPSACGWCGEKAKSA